MKKSIMALLLGMAAMAEGTSYKVGICNYVDDASLNQIVENIQARLEAIGQEKGVTFEVNYVAECEKSGDYRMIRMAKVYAEYQRRLWEANALDFDDLLLKTLELLAEHPPVLEAYRRRFRYILVDEYQDISKARYRLLKTLRNSQDYDLFCVGDDWQAINRFAGSDLKFFNNFDHYFADAQHYNINTNYRCENHIVSEAGDFMKRFGIPGKAQRGFLKDTGVFEELHIGNDKAKDFPEYEWLFTKKGPWETDEGIDTPYNNYVLSYIKTCSQIINENPGKKIMILNRTRKFLGKSLDEIARILKNSKLCKVESPNIDVKTVHQSKGEESDVVILTEVDENHFPILHPDNNLYSVFGENEYTSAYCERMGKDIKTNATH